jgi:pimeloyl-ACP methyl ester carboxylesterase
LRFVREYGDRVMAVLHGLGVSAPHAAEMWSAYASLSEPDKRRAFIRTLRAVIDPGGQAVSATNRLYLAAAAPTLIAWRDRDSIIPVEHAYAAHELMPGSRLEIFEGAGHFLHAEQPGRFAELLCDFIESTEPARGDLASYRQMLRARAG